MNRAWPSLRIRPTGLTKAHGYDLFPASRRQGRAGSRRRPHPALRRQRPDRRRGHPRPHRRGADAGVDERRGPAEDAGDRRGLLLQPLAPGPLEEGRDLRPGAEGARTARGLRPGRGVDQGRSPGRRRRLPHRRALVLLPRVGGRPAGREVLSGEAAALLDEDGAHILEFVLEAGGERLDKALAAVLPELSRARLQALIAEGALTHEGRAISSGSAKAQGGVYRLVVPAPMEADPRPQDIAQDVLYEDA